MQTKTTLLTFALLFAVAALACDATQPDQLRGFEGGTDGGSESDTGGSDPSPGHICVSDLDGISAERDDTYTCPVDYTHACWASDYPIEVEGTACCKLFEESDCFMNWGSTTCPANHVKVCGVEALGNNNGPGVLVCGDGDYMYLEAEASCDGGYLVICDYESYPENSSGSVCCDIGGAPDACNYVPTGIKCLAVQNHVCNIP